MENEIYFLINVHVTEGDVFLPFNLNDGMIIDRDSQPEADVIKEQFDKYLPGYTKKYEKYETVDDGQDLTFENWNSKL